MPARNVEIKAKLLDKAQFEIVFSNAQHLCEGAPAIMIQQEDTFFQCIYGRLKLRVLGQVDGQLICYKRPDEKGPKLSSYDIFETKQPDKLKSVLQSALGSTGTVTKRRMLFIHNQTRIHLDNVDDLGYFLELEVVLTETQTPEDGRQRAEDLMSQLGITPDQLIEGAYVDLLKTKKRPVAQDQDELQSAPKKSSVVDVNG